MKHKSRYELKLLFGNIHSMLGMFNPLKSNVRLLYLKDPVLTAL